MKKVIAVTLVATLIGCVVLAGGGLAAALSDYELPWCVMGSGGGKAQSASYALIATLGQTAPGSSSSPSYQIRAGFGPGVGPSYPHVPTPIPPIVSPAIWLPLIMLTGGE